MKAELSSITIHVASDNGGGLTPRKSSPFWHKSEDGRLFDNCYEHGISIRDFAAKETGLEIVSYDFYYSFEFVVEIKDTFEIPHAMRKLERFVDKHFKPWKPTK